MMASKYFWVFAVSLLPGLVKPVSYVYNLRLSEPTKRQKVHGAGGAQKQSTFAHPYYTAVTPAWQIRERYDDVHELVQGGLVTFMRFFGRWHVRADWALGNVKEQDCFHVFSRTQTDDLLFSAGYSIPLSRAVITMIGMLGIPTHQDTSLVGIQFGTGHVGLGVQGDIGWNYSKKNMNALIGVGRIVHFFPRSAKHECVHELTKIYPGNQADFLLAHQWNWPLNRIELGYNGTWFFGTMRCSALSQLCEPTLMRTSLYGLYKRTFFIKKLPSAITFAFSGGFEQKKRATALRWLASPFATWELNF